MISILQKMGLKPLLKKLCSYDQFDTFPDGIIILNYQKNIVYWNSRATEIFGFSKKEVMGRNIGVVFVDEIDKLYQSLGSKKSSILAARRNNDVEIFVEITCADSYTEEEIVISIRDVTRNQKIIEKLLIEYDKASNISKNKSSFLAGLSHDLKTPLHSIIGFSQALLDGLGGELSEKQDKYLSVINKNSNNLLALISNILDLSKLESGKMEYTFKLFDIVHVVNSLTETISPAMHEKKLDFSVDLAEISKRNIFSDENMIRQILSSILNNAVKFTETGAIKLKTIHPDIETVKYHGIEPPEEFTDKSYLLFSVSDTGIGIVEEELNNIFDEYRPIDKAISKKYGGTGLGLAITGKILREIGGVIWVESEAGKGSIFNCIIPVERVRSLEESLN